MNKKELLELSKRFQIILEYEIIPEVNKIEKKSILRKPSIFHIRKPPLNNKQENSQNSQKS